MKVLVTGAAGFLGSHVARFLSDSGFDVTGFDARLDEGAPFAWVTGDLRDADSVNQAVSGQDVVCHLGAVGDVYLAASDPSLASAVNVVGTSNVAQAAVKHDARVVYASTWEVYGEPRYQPIDEDHPCRPDHPYNITKLAGEQLLMAAGHLQGLPVVALRLGTAYGPGLRSNSVFRIFIDRAKAGEPITLQGDGLQGRQFTHARDLARAFLLACRSDRYGMALNVVANRMVTIKEVAEAVISRYPTELRFSEARPGDVPPAEVSAQRIGEILGWKAEMSFEQGLEELLEGCTTLT